MLVNKRSRLPASQDSHSGYTARTLFAHLLSGKSSGAVAQLILHEVTPAVQIYKTARQRGQSVGLRASTFRYVDGTVPWIVTVPGGAAMLVSRHVCVVPPTDGQLR